MSNPSDGPVEKNGEPLTVIPLSTDGRVTEEVDVERLVVRRTRRPEGTGFTVTTERPLTDNDYWKLAKIESTIKHIFEKVNAE